MKQFQLNDSLAFISIDDDKSAATSFMNRGGKPPRRKMSAKGRARIAAGQKARWSKVKGNKATAAKQTMSASARRKIAAAQPARWAKVGKKKAA